MTEIHFQPKNTEYLESTMEALVIEILICRKYLCTNHKYCDFNASLMCGVMEEKYNLQCPKLQIHSAGSNNVWIFNTSPKTSQNVQDVHHYISSFQFMGTFKMDSLWHKN